MNARLAGLAIVVKTGPWTELTVQIQMQTAPTLMDIPVNADGETRLFTIPDSVNMRAVATGILEGKTYPSLRFLADQVDCVLDIGANAGAATLYFNYVYPNAAIYAYEPGADAFDLLLRNTRDLDRVTATNVGLGAETGTVALHLGGLGGEVSSVFPNFGMDGDRTEQIILRRASIEFMRWCGDAKFPVLKIDTEGCEVPILRDLGNHLDRVAAVYVEYHSDGDRLEIEEIMQQYDLTLFSAAQSHTHRGENMYVRQRLLDEYTTISRYILRA